MILRTTAIITLAALAAGCSSNGSGNSSTTTTTTSSSTSSLPSAASIGLQPGKWETKVEVVDLKVTGMPGGATIPKPAPQTVSSCLTPEQAAKGPGDLLKQAGADCTVNSSDYSGGKMNVDMTCKTPAGTMAVKSTGSYTATSMASESEVNVTGKMAMTQKSKMEAHRVGDCS